MSFDTLRFASLIDARSYLSYLMGGVRIIIGSVEPKKGDMVVFYHPEEDNFYAVNFPGISAGQLKKSDIIEKFDGNATEEKIGQAMRVKFLTPWFKARKTISENDVPSFIWANSIDADHDLKNGEFNFALEERASAGSSRTRGRFQRRDYGNFNKKKFTKEGNIKSFKKNPKRMMKKVKPKSDAEAYKEMQQMNDTSAGELDAIFNTSPTFSSVEEALQFLSDITESTIKIQK